MHGNDHKTSPAPFMLGLHNFITPSSTGLAQTPDRGQSRKEHLHGNTGDNGSVVTTEEMVTAITYNTGWTQVAQSGPVTSSNDLFLR